MTITVTEFKKNFSHYEQVAINKRVVVVNEKTGVKFTFKGENPMKKRLENMRKGDCSTLDEAFAIAHE
jgi:hypothetical protein